MSAPCLGAGVWTFLGADTLRRQVGEDYDEYRVAAGRVTRHVHDSGKVRYPDGSTYTGTAYRGPAPWNLEFGELYGLRAGTFADMMNNPISRKDLVSAAEKALVRYNKKHASG